MKLKRNLLLMAAFGTVYLLIEVIWTAITSWSLSFIGHTSLWIFFIGAPTGFILGLFNEKGVLRGRVNLFWQSVIGMCVIFAIEYASGCLLNLIFGLGIWSYADLWLNINGQITFLFAPLWFLICPFTFWFDDLIRWYAFDRDANIPADILMYYRLSFQPRLKPEE